LPPFNKPGSAFYTDDTVWKTQEILIRQLARVISPQDNIMGFDLGNEINTCWSREPPVGDVWMTKLFSLVDQVYPQGINFNGLDELPWFESNTFSPQSSQPAPCRSCTAIPSGQGR
jgi:hypothetical protein